VEAIDPDVTVRLVTHDDAKQAKHAAAVFGSSLTFIPKTILLETEWVLRYGYGLHREDIALSLRGILGLSGVTAEDAVSVRRALDLFDRGLDFADTLHLAGSAEANGFTTIDSTLAKRARASGFGDVRAI